MKIVDEIHNFGLIFKILGQTYPHTDVVEVGRFYRAMEKISAIAAISWLKKD
jgi:hypothetical protein